MHNLNISDLHILLIEPSDTQQKIIKNMLVDQAITHVTCVHDLATAKAEIQHHAPDLIISAMHFSDGVSIDLLTYLKSQPDTADISFMLVSSEDRLEKLEAFKQAGVVAILPKPFALIHLKRALNASLQMINTEEVELSSYDIVDVRVLVVDDSLIARNHNVRVLQGMGLAKIEQAENGSQALTLVKDQEFDLIVTDYNMPEMDGRELSEFIRFNPSTAHIPIIMVTSESINSPHMANIQQTGVNALCDKPFEPEEVKRMLIALLSP